MNSTSELNKYDKKTLELKKRKFVHSKWSRKRLEGSLGRVTSYNAFVFLLMKTKIGTHFAYFANTAKSKAKVQQ